MNYCRYCGNELPQRSTSGGRALEFCPGSKCRVAHHRREKRYRDKLSGVTIAPKLTGVLILELFPGAGLFGKSFEALGATVVRAPDILWGGDVREFKGLPGKFDGIIGGPPCQFASRAAVSGTKAQNLIPEFIRLVNECSPVWAVMENVREAKPYAPRWDYVFLRDWDCCGFTHRTRGFWFYGLDAPPAPPRRPGTPEYSALASNWNRRGLTKLHGHLHLTPQRAAELQGFPQLAEKIIHSQPGWLRQDGKWDGVSAFSRDVLATHMIGNGVTAAVGHYIAEYVATMIA